MCVEAEEQTQRAEANRAKAENEYGGIGVRGLWVKFVVPCPRRGSWSEGEEGIEV